MEPDDAIMVLEEAIAKLGPNPVAYSQIAINCITIKKFNKAEINFRKAIKFENNNVSLFYDETNQNHLTEIVIDVSFNPSAVALTFIFPGVVSGRIMARHIPW